MKGNSERVPNKNIKLFDGKPLFSKIIDTIKSSKIIDDIIVNTDNETIINMIYELYGDSVKIHKRPDNLVGDMVPMNEIINYDLSISNSDIYVQTHTTNPLLLISSLESAIHKFVEASKSGTDSIFSVTKLQTRLFDKGKKPINHDPKDLKRTQDLDPVYEENSCFYIFDKDSFSNAGNKRIGNNPELFSINKIESVDIDEPEDFIIAEALYKLLR